jgi:hypothetical protein
MDPFCPVRHPDWSLNLAHAIVVGRGTAYKHQACAHACVNGLEDLQSTCGLEKVGAPVPAHGRADGASWRELRGGHPLACP